MQGTDWETFCFCSSPAADPIQFLLAVLEPPIVILPRIQARFPIIADRTFKCGRQQSHDVANSKPLSRRSLWMDWCTVGQSRQWTGLAVSLSGNPMPTSSEVYRRYLAIRRHTPWVESYHVGSSTPGYLAVIGASGNVRPIVG